MTTRPTYRLSIFTLLLLFYSSVCLLAQEHDYHQYTTADGLPTNYVYGVVEDDEGYIWAYTENGVAKFDGYQFQHFSTKDGLPGNDVILCIKDKNGKLWLRTYGIHSSAYIEADSVVVLNEKSKNSTNMYLVDGEVIYSPPHYEFHYTDEVMKKTPLWYTDSLKMEQFPNSWQVDSVRASKNVQKGKLPISGGDSMINLSVDSIFFLRHKVGENNQISFSDNTAFSPIYFIYENETKYPQTIYWAQGNEWISFPFDRTIKPSNTIKNQKIPYRNEYLLTIDNINYHWIRPRKQTSQYLRFEGVDRNKINFNLPSLFDSSILFSSNIGFLEYDYEVKLLDKFLPRSLSQQYYILRSFKDSKGNIWIGSREGGLFMIPAHKRKTHLLSKRFSNDRAFEQVLRTAKGEVLGFTDNSGVYLLQSDSLICLLEPNKKQRFRVAAQTPFGILMSADHGGYVIDKNLKIQAFIDAFPIFSHGGEKHQRFMNRTSIAYDLTNQKFYGGGIEVIPYELNEPQNTTGIFSPSPHIHFQPSQAVLYIGNTDGVFTLKNKQIIPFLDSLKDISSLASTEQQLWIGTENSGLYTYHFETKALHQISEAAYIRQVRPYQDGTWLVACNEGILVVDSLKEHRRYTDEDGLFINEIRAADYDGERYIYVANSEGLLQLDTWWEDKAQLSANALQLKEVLVNETAVDFDNARQLKHNENTLEFKYHLISFESNQNITYLSKLSPLESEWREHSGRSSFYLSLPPNDYQFHLKARDIYGNEVALPPFPISIRAAFWQRAWFWLLVLALLFGGVFTYFWQRDRRRKKAQVAEKIWHQKVADLELSALRAQMNPHFVFNALGSIQYYIQINENKIADEYLTSFAELMRMYLDSSKENFIRLKDEIELLTLYTDLEQMRFEDLFEVEFFISKNMLIENIYLPSMLIQPYVENAINHGLHARNDKQGKLHIHFSKTNNLLHCRIEDNGIGRAKAQSRKKSKHISRGMSIIQEKIHTLRLSGIADVRVEINNLTTENEAFPGTAVDVVIQLFPDEDIKSNYRR